MDAPVGEIVELLMSVGRRCFIGLSAIAAIVVSLTMRDCYLLIAVIFILICFVLYIPELLKLLRKILLN